MSGRFGARTLPVSEDLVRALVSCVDESPYGTRTETICNRMDESPQRLGDAFEFVKEREILLGFAGLWLHPAQYDVGVERFLNALAEIHRTEPGTGAVSPGRIARVAELDWTDKASARIARDLIGRGRLKGDEDGVRIPDFRAEVTPRQEASIARVVEVLEGSGFRPPVGPELAAAVNLPVQALPEVLRSGEFTDRLVPMEAGIWTTPAMVTRAYEAFGRAAENGQITIAAARNALDASRRYAHAFLVRLAEEGRVENLDGEWRIV